MGKLTAEDRLDIMEAIASYSRCIDEPRFEDLPGLFVADAEIDCGPLGQYQGADGVARFAATIKSISAGQMMRHYVTNITIQADGDCAQARMYVLAMVGPGPGRLNTSTGFYEDELVKQGGRWLFRKRRVLLDMQQ